MSTSPESPKPNPVPETDNLDVAPEIETSKMAATSENLKPEKVPTKHNLDISYCLISQEVLDTFVEDFHIPSNFHPTLPGSKKPIYPFPEGKIGLYFDFFKQANYRIPFTPFLFEALEYFGIHIAQCNPPGLSILNHFELSCRALGITPNVTLFHAFYRLTMGGNWYTFEKRRELSPICSSKPATNRLWKNQFFYLDNTCVPSTMIWRDPKFAIRDDPPKKETINQKHFTLIGSFSFPVRKLPEEILVAAQISTHWSNPHLRPSFFNEGAKMDLSGVLKLRDFSSLTFESPTDHSDATPTLEPTGATSSTTVATDKTPSETQETDSVQNPPTVTTKRRKHIAKGHHESPKKDEPLANKRSKKEVPRKTEKAVDANAPPVIVQSEKTDVPRRSPRHNVQNLTPSGNDNTPSSETQMDRLADAVSPSDDVSFKFEKSKSSPVSPPSLSYMISSDDITMNEYFATSPPATLEITEENPSTTLTSSHTILPPIHPSTGTIFPASQSGLSSSSISTFLSSTQNEIEWLKSEYAQVKTRRTAGYNLGELFLPNWNINNNDSFTDPAIAKDMFLHSSTPNDVKFLQGLPPSVLASRIAAIQAENQSIIPELYNRWIRAENANLSNEIAQMQTPAIQSKIQRLEKDKMALMKAKNDMAQKKVLAELALNETRSMVDMLKKQQLSLEKKNLDALKETESLTQEKKLLNDQLQTSSAEVTGLKDALTQQRHKFEEERKALGKKLEELEEEKRTLQYDKSWLLQEGIDAIVKKLFKDPDLVSTVGNINNAMNACGVNEGLILGFHYAKTPGTSVGALKEFDKDANKKLHEATEAFKHMSIPFLKQFPDLYDAPLETIQEIILGDKLTHRSDQPESATKSHNTPSSSA
ncbi:hypothetical protein SSX86_022321 [Deinandra increscens subsp. villosa]|uniref:Transposase (putative) gypsy type domain-containing protein n=1 Tax=Deinandra increscens subsp. villosa TaxID=3103831 RepID=A0AAP0CNU3_9ASTR